MALKKEDVSSSTVTVLSNKHTGDQLNNITCIQQAEQRLYGLWRDFWLQILHRTHDLQRGGTADCATVTVAVSPMAIEIGSLMEREQALLTGSR